MTVKPIKDIRTYKPTPYYWVKMPAKNIRADMYDELYSSLQNVPNDVVSNQIQKIDSQIQFYDKHKNFPFSPEKEELISLLKTFGINAQNGWKYLTSTILNQEKLKILLRSVAFVPSIFLQK